jgi:hypothetical protein
MEETDVRVEGFLGRMIVRSAGCRSERVATLEGAFNDWVVEAVESLDQLGGVVEDVRRTVDVLSEEISNFVGIPGIRVEEFAENGVGVTTC